MNGIEETGSPPPSAGARPRLSALNSSNLTSSTAKHSTSDAVS